MGIIHCDAGLKCLVRLSKCLFPIIVSFSYIYILQGSVATQLEYVGYLIIMLLETCSGTVKQF